MRTKLLRKLHKRFNWLKDETEGCWTVYDKKTQSIHYCYIIGFYYINDMAIHKMLDRMGKLKWFTSLHDRLRIRHKNYGTDRKV